MSLHDVISSVIPTDHARQVTSEYYVAALLRDGWPAVEVVDLGCGTGASVDLFRRHERSVKWRGLDIESSPEVDARQRSDAEFYTYNGTIIPFDDESVDIVYSNQVFEHVRHPEILLGEVRRVLRPGGHFIGSVSSLEPYHSYSLWNFTPYGWYVILQDSGLEPREFRSGIDGISLIKRQYLGRPEEARNWFKLSPINDEIDAWARASGRGNRATNLRKLQFCGHLVFWASKKLSQ
jgi:SAM-dependent methyltransferase